MSTTIPPPGTPEAQTKFITLCLTAIALCYHYQDRRRAENVTKHMLDQWTYSPTLMNTAKSQVQISTTSTISYEGGGGAKLVLVQRTQVDWADPTSEDDAPATRAQPADLSDWKDEARGILEKAEMALETIDHRRVARFRQLLERWFARPSD